MTSTNQQRKTPLVADQNLSAVPGRAIALLADLIALPTVNPMGRPYDGQLPVERPVIEYFERLFAPFGVPMQRQSCSAFHESLLVMVRGRADARGTLLESHIDTVPADDWLSQAFVPRIEGTKIVGRGACDDKGSLAAMALAVLEILESGQQPPQPIWFLAAGDEEHAQTGIKQFLAGPSHPIGRAVFGEPTDLTPVIQHKGTIRWDITVHGQSAHTSRAELGRSAILDMLKVIEALDDHERQLRATHSSALMSGPSLTVTMIEGGRTRNMVPDQCKIAVDFRTLPAMTGKQAVEDVFARLDALGVSLDHSPFQCFAPPLGTDPEDPFVRRVAEICRSRLGRAVTPSGAPYGSDAGWMPAKVPTIVLGPGNIAQAHAVNEFVEIQQVVGATAVYKEIMLRDWNQAEESGTAPA